MFFLRRKLALKIGLENRILNVAPWGYIGVIEGRVNVLSQRCRTLTVFAHIGAIGICHSRNKW
jgi:hypothetical protein